MKSPFIAILELEVQVEVRCPPSRPFLPGATSSILSANEGPPTFSLSDVLLAYSRSKACCKSRFGSSGSPAFLLCNRPFARVTQQSHGCLSQHSNFVCYRIWLSRAKSISCALWTCIAMPHNIRLQNKAPIITIVWLVKIAALKAELTCGEPDSDSEKTPGLWPVGYS